MKSGAAGNEGNCPSQMGWLTIVYSLPPHSVVGGGKGQGKDKRGLLVLCHSPKFHVEFSLRQPSSLFLRYNLNLLTTSWLGANQWSDSMSHFLRYADSAESQNIYWPDSGLVTESIKITLSLRHLGRPPTHAKTIMKEKKWARAHAHRSKTEMTQDQCSHQCAEVLEQ